MCCANQDWLPSSPRIPSTRPRFHSQTRSKLRIHRLCILRRSRCEEARRGRDMELKNLKLYLENKSIIEENERLRQKALRLRQENLALLADFHKRFYFPN